MNVVSKSNVEADVVGQDFSGGINFEIHVFDLQVSSDLPFQCRQHPGHTAQACSVQGANISLTSSLL
jgi:hypothetical protein